MSKNTIDKIKLIYEFNNHSPLFARVASSELENGNYDSALEMVEEGLKKYPDYITAKLVYAETLANLGRYEKVIEEMEKIKEELDDEKTINYYLEYFEEIKEKQQNESSEKDNDKTSGDENDIEKLAEKVRKAKMPKIDNASTTDFKGPDNKKSKNIVSETLAGIYYSQGSYSEALEIYEQLLESNPSKAEFYMEKINEIKSQM